MRIGKSILIILLIVILSTIVSAIPPVQTTIQPEGLTIAYPQYEYIKQNSDFTLYVHVQNQSNFLTGTDASCWLDLYNSTGQETMRSRMLESDSDYYTPIYNNFTDMGIHSFIIQCNTTSQTGFANGVFEITYNGKALSQSQSTIYLGLLGILIFTLFATFFGMSYLPGSNEKDEEGRILSISYLKYLRLPMWLFAYFLFIAIIYISSNIAFAFLSEQLFAKLLFAIFVILMSLSPIIIIVLVISFFVKFYHDKEFQGLFKRGIFPGDDL